ILEELLLRETPTRRDRREETEALVLGEDVRAVITADELQEVLVLEIVVDTGEVVLPRRQAGAAVVVLLRIAAGEHLVQLIRYEILPECAEVGIVGRLPLNAAQQVQGVISELAL